VTPDKLKQCNAQPDGRPFVGWVRTPVLFFAVCGPNEATEIAGLDNDGRLTDSDCGVFGLL